MKKVRMGAWMWCEAGLKARQGCQGCQGYHNLRCVMLSRPPLDAMPNSMRSKSSSYMS